MQIELSPERQAQLDEYARFHGQDLSTALDEVLADALEWDEEDRKQTIEGIRRGLADMRAGRTRPAAEALEELRIKYGFPR